MKKDNVRETVLAVKENISSVNIIDDESAVRVFIETYFPIVRASTLSLDDMFLRNEPETRKQCDFKALLTSAIESGLKDFRAQRIDPSFDDNGNIVYGSGQMPAVGKSPNWWKENAIKFLPEKRSRLGTNKEHIAFLGLLLKYLVDEENYTVSDAWKAVCDQSKGLAHYWNSEDSKRSLEPTGSRKIGEWYDLANTYKITTDENTASSFFHEGGHCQCNGESFPLTTSSKIIYPDIFYFGSVGWIVLDV